MLLMVSGLLLMDEMSYHAAAAEMTETVLDGWVTDAAGKIHYYVNGEKLTGLQVIDSKMYYFTLEKGNMLQSSWKKFAEGKRYFCKDGTCATGLKKVGDNTYYFDTETGIMATSTWMTFSAGKSYFTSGGVRVTGRKKKIDGKYYYFNSKGIMKTGLRTINSKTFYFSPSTGVMVQSKWVTFSNGKSYFNSNGVRAIGLKKISGKYYYFNTKGILQTGTITVGSDTYYADSTGVLEHWIVDGVYYNSAGEKMDSVAVKEFQTMLRAEAIAESITTSDMTQAQKLKVCFDWVMSKHYATMTVGINYPGWTADHANDHFLYGRGNCFADACAMAYLAVAIGYTEVYVCSDSTGSGAHGWCEINGLVYDPLFAQAKSYSKYYGASYSSYYTSKPALHVKIEKN
ncbi:MAG: hypothetical protein LUH20_03140 [Lachnospiraceae bacterium]|nr:hypothetical protein [Lachnospiraceae bacterium]